MPDRPKLTLLEGGDEFFAHLLGSIARAREQISLETYIFADDVIGHRVADALERAAGSGVRVRVIIDWLGSRPDLPLWRDRFAGTGVALQVFNPCFRQGLARTHRKIATIDASLGYIGGINIKDDFNAGHKRPRLRAPRWDLAVALDGEAVHALQKIFNRQWEPPRRLVKSREQWHYLQQRISPPLAVWGQPHPALDMALITRDNLKRRTAIQAIYRTAIRNASREVILVTPYFAPGIRLRRLLLQASKRGVKVILLLGTGEMRLQDLVGRAYYPHLLKHGVAIYEYRKTLLHAKVAVVDDVWATLGSSNCDALSLFINQEANLVVRDYQFAQELKQRVLRALSESDLVSLAAYEQKSYWKRCFYWVAYTGYRLIMRIITKGEFR